jgi:hypothetical protein
MSVWRVVRLDPPHSVLLSNCLLLRTEVGIPGTVFTTIPGIFLDLHWLLIFATIRNWEGALGQ